MFDRAGSLLGVDLGERRIGVATGDPTGFLASPLTVIESRGRARDVAAIRQLANEHGAAAVVVGVPINMDGSYGSQAEKSRRFGDALSATGVSVIYWDERLTTVEAGRRLRDAGARGTRVRERIDATAAAILLQSYLDARRRE